VQIGGGRSAFDVIGEFLASTEYRGRFELVVEGKDIFDCASRNRGISQEKFPLYRGFFGQ
jgi:hypothetical protein